jgi:PAS domain S-box-containing protein
LPNRNVNGDIVGTFGVARDITAQLNTQRSLQASEKRLKKAQEMAKIGNWEYDISTGKVWGSEEAFRIYGFERITEFLPLDEVESCIIDVERVNQALAALIAKNKIYDIEYKINSKIREGLTLIHSMADLVCDAEGNPVKVDGVIQDITEYRRMEEERRQSEETYQNLLDNLNAGVVVHAPDTSILIANATACSLLGLTKDQMLGKEAIDPQWQFVREDGSDMPLEEYPVSQVLFTDEPLRNLVVGIKRSQVDDVSWVMVNGFAVLNGSGQVEQVIISFIDITENKRAEESLKESEVKYRSMMEAMDDAVYICSGDFRIEYLNTAMIKRLGYDATGEICHKVMHGIDEKCPWCVHDKVMSGQFIKTEVVSPKDNRAYHVSNSPIFHSHGAVSKLTIFRDITEQKKVEERLLQAQKMEAIGSLAGGIAHDLNNILFPISGFSEMLLDEIPPDNHTHESIEQIYKSAKRGSDLVNQILAFSRQSNLQKLSIRIQPILKEVLKLVRATIPKNIELTSHIEKDCGRVLADPTQIHQIAMNLITNAYHAVEEKGGSINIELKETEFGRDDFHDNVI